MSSPPTNAKPPCLKLSPDGSAPRVASYWHANLAVKRENVFPSGKLSSLRFWSSVKSQCFYALMLNVNSTFIVIFVVKSKQEVICCCRICKREETNCRINRITTEKFVVGLLRPNCKICCPSNEFNATVILRILKK